MNTLETTYNNYFIKYFLCHHHRYSLFVVIIINAFVNTHTYIHLIRMCVYKYMFMYSIQFMCAEKYERVNITLLLFLHIYTIHTSLSDSEQS